MVLRQDETPQLGPEVPGGSRRKRRHHGVPVERQPALATVADHPRADLQILHHIDLVALEARAGRNRRPDDPILDRRNRRWLAPTAPALAIGLQRRRRTCLLHAAGLARLDLGPALQALQSRNLLALLAQLLFERGNFFQQIANPSLQFGWRETI